MYVQYVIIGKQKCIQCHEFKKLLDEKEIQYNSVSRTRVPRTCVNLMRRKYNMTI